MKCLVRHLLSFFLYRDNDCVDYVDYVDYVDAADKLDIRRLIQVYVDNVHFTNYSTLAVWVQAHWLKFSFKTRRSIISREKMY